MRRPSKSLKLVPNTERLKLLKDKNFIITDKSKPFFAAMLARITYIVQPELDEDDAADIIEEFLKTEKLNVKSIHRLALMLRTTGYNQDVDTLH